MLGKNLDIFYVQGNRFHLKSGKLLNILGNPLNKFRSDQFMPYQHHWSYLSAFHLSFLSETLFWTGDYNTLKPLFLENPFTLVELTYRKQNIKGK